MKTIRSKVLFCITLLFVSGFTITAQQPQLVIQTGHADFITTVALSSNGMVIASGSWDQTIKLWDIRSGKELRTLKGHTRPVNSIAFSRDGKVIVSGSGDKTIRLWDAATGKQLRSLVGHTDAVESVAFSSGGNVIASGSKDKTIKLWDAATGKPLRSLTGHTAGVESVAFSPNGRVIASGSADHTIKLWDATTGNLLLSIQDQIGTYEARSGRLGGVDSVTFSPDGKLIASGNNDETIKLWNATTGKQLRSIETGRDRVMSVAFSPDGKVVAGGTAYGFIELWEVASGKHIRSFEDIDGPVRSVVFSLDGKMLASSNGSMIGLWDAATGKRFRSLKRHAFSVNSVAFSAEGKLIASGSDDKTIKVWDAVAGKLRSLAEHTGSVLSIAFSPNGKLIASGGGDNDGSIKLWDADSGKLISSVVGSRAMFRPLGWRFGSYTGQPMLEPPGPVWSVAFSPNGKVIASGNDDGTIILWNTANNDQLRCSLDGHCGEDAVVNLFDKVFSVAFSPNGKMIASGNNDETIKLWDATSGKQLRSTKDNVGTFMFFNSRFGGVQSVAFSPDGKVVASGNYDGTIKLWDEESGKQLGSLKGDAHSIKSVTFSPDGKVIASGNDDGTIRLWNAATGKQLRSFAEHIGRVRSVAFSPDGKLIISGSDDSTLRLWQTETGNLLATLISLDNEDWVVVTPDNRFDTGSLENIEGLHWVVPDAPFITLPLEIFMRDYYEPRLLPRILKCNEENNCDKEFKPVRDISKLNRVQPPVKISDVSLPDADGYVNVTVEVGGGEGKYLVNGKESTRTTGVYDVRLFRDGQIVGEWPRDGAEKLLQQTSKDFESSAKLTGEERVSKELRDWQEATEVRIDRGTSPTVREGSLSKPNYQVKIDPKTGLMTLPPFRVKLPRGKNVSEIDFSAYAFNEDRVKSQTEHWQWPDDLKAKLPKAQPVKPRAYIVSVGVNAYENADFDLEFAADDARRMAEVLTEKLTATGQYEKVIPVTLISDYVAQGKQKIARQKQATKENFRAVLERLAGKNPARGLLAGVVNADQLQRATPDDLVIIMYSSHGYADRAGNFYFIPYDTGPGSGKVFTESVRRHSISSEELSLWLRDVDAGEMVMIVDACHSTAAVAGQEFKPGPMGSRGLGQLSYDKGMRILTATQSDNVAWEYPTLKQGMLTYALVRDGIEAEQADHDKDNTITMAEWLAFGVERVPKLYEEVLTGHVQSFGLASSGQPKLVVTRDGKPTKGSKELEEILKGPRNSGTAQQPSLFDFTRKKRPVVLAKTN